ncbi:MAG: zinc-binding dehydrogenase [bacterium]
MRALRKLAPGPGNVDVVDTKEPRPQQGEVLIRVCMAGVCGTDLHILHGLFPKVRPPVTLGHEFCGEVVEVGSGVRGWKPGDRVTVESASGFCGNCVHCVEGQTQRCEERLAFGYARDGGFAPFVTARASALHRLPDHVDFQEGALCEPLACATHAVMERSSLLCGQMALVAGPGPIGLLVLQVARAVGAEVILVGTSEDRERLDLGLGMGARHVLVAGGAQNSELIGQWTHGAGVDVAFECSGSIASFSSCIQWVKKGGQVVQVGLLGKEEILDLDSITYKEVELRGCFAHNHRSWEKAIDLLQRKEVSLLPLVSGIYSLEEWKEPFARFQAHQGLKYLLKP